FPCTRQTDAYISMAAFSRTIDHAPHYCHIHRFHTRILRFPAWHLLAQVPLNIVSQLLENGTASTTTPGTSHHHGGKSPKPHRLQNFLCHDNFARTVTTRLGCEGDTNSIAYPLLQQHRKRRSRGDNPLTTHTRFS